VNTYVLTYKGKCNGKISTVTFKAETMDDAWKKARKITRKSEVKIISIHNSRYS